MRSNPWLPIVGAAAFGILVSGCSKKQEVAVTPAATSEATSQTVAPPATAPRAAAPVVNPAETRVASEVNFQVKDLELQVDAYQKIYKRKPESLEQMVREGFLSSLPPAPPGKRYSLDPATSRVSLAP